MSRFRQASLNMVASYAVLGGNALFGLASLPLALYYLRDNLDQYALWLLMSNIALYLSLIDLGMSNSVARLLIDYKDRRDGGEYGSMIRTGWLVLITQGIIILLAGLALAPLLATVLQIKLQTEFIHLMGWQSLTLALAFCFRIFSHLLYAHQRTDIQNYGQIVSLVLNFGLMWWFFRKGHGVYSFAWAGILSGLVSQFICFQACRRLKLFPAAGTWGKANWQRFREVFAYGKDMFLVAVGVQLIMASQTMIIQRVLGEKATILWGVGTKLFSLVSQVVWRLGDVAMPVFSEMIVRGEREKLQARFKEMLIVAASVSVFLGIGFVICNRTFVTVLSSGKVSWPTSYDVGLAAWMVVLGIQRGHNMLMMQAKQVGFIPYIYFIEGLIFVVAAVLLAKIGGILAVIICSIVCTTLFSHAYGVWRTHKYFDVPVMMVGAGWLKLMGRTLLLCAPVGLVIWWAGQLIETPVTRLIFYGLLYGPSGLYLLLRYGITESFQRELSSRAPKGVSPVLRRIFAAAT